MAQKTEKKTGSLLKQLALFVIIVGALYLSFIFLIMPLYTRHWQRIKVPDVAFLSSAAAQKLIKKNGLVPLEGEKKNDNTVPPGFVVFQNPSGNSFVKKGRRVYLVTSLGKQKVKVPNLVGVNLRDAHFVLFQRQLEIGDIVYEFDSYFPEDVIMEQATDPEAEISAGSTIDLVVSMGEEPRDFIVPNLLGQPRQEAERLIKKAGLTLGRVHTKEKQETDVNKVIYQSLPANERVAKGDTIDIVISIMAPGQEENIPW